MADVSGLPKRAIVEESPLGSSSPPPTRKSPRIDGRHLRSERTKRLIVEAYMVLVRESSQMPTALQIAERAGYSVRSIFERFPDLHAIRVAATDYAIGEAKALGAPRDTNADRQTRIRSQVETRARSCERWLPFWRILNAGNNDSPELRQRIKMIRQLILMRIEVMFKPELVTLAEPERKKTLIALEALMDFESWARMIELFGLSHEQACTVWIRAIDRLLPPTPVS
ncbi:TetR/AcrR family transcriptional regulator [Reyranella sp.]|jgi:AcrR family transcriptional regulator|uniref:TetR/AcrR family transcriptional regulator n=1 Tax=Reyranella sp. TaxID=1929291 RepID=UPI002F941C2E